MGNIGLFILISLLSLFISISLYKTARTITPNIIYFLPRNTDPNQLTALAALPIATTSTPTSSTTSHDGICEVEATYLNDRQKCITAYYGNLAYDDGGGGDLEGHQGEDIERGGW